jgi:S-methylmethionine-dependent homocysteine/selenocysteine methylase
VTGRATHAAPDRSKEEAVPAYRPSYRDALPQLSGDLFLADAGLETDLIFNHGIEMREFAAHTVLPDPEGRAALIRYYEGFLRLAGEMKTGFILDSVTWRAHAHWADALGASKAELRAANEDSIGLIAELRRRFAGNAGPIVLNAVAGPCGDAYRPDIRIAVEDAEKYYAEQLGWLAETEADMATALTFNQAGEAAGLPAAVSFTVETDGRLPTGQSLSEAIAEVDAVSDGCAAYFMINCAHPTHFADALDEAPWARRICGIRANASRKSHAELDESTELDPGDPRELAGQYRDFAARLPWLNIFGGCCGSDLRHVTEIARPAPRLTWAWGGLSPATPGESPSCRGRGRMDPRDTASSCLGSQANSGGPERIRTFDLCLRRAAERPPNCPKLSRKVADFLDASSCLS